MGLLFIAHCNFFLLSPAGSWRLLHQISVVTGMRKDKKLSSVASLDTCSERVFCSCVLLFEYMNDLYKASNCFPQNRLGLTVKLKAGKNALAFLKYLSALPLRTEKSTAFKTCFSPCKLQSLKQMKPHCCSTNKIITLCLSIKILIIQSPVAFSPR